MTYTYHISENNVKFIIHLFKKNHITSSNMTLNMKVNYDVQEKNKNCITLQQGIHK